MHRIAHIFLLLSAYLLLLAWNGYDFGNGDMIELLPYASYLSDTSLYANDFYLQNSIANFPDKRYVLVQLFYWLNGGAWLAFSLHFLCTIFLLEGLYRIAKKYITAEILIWAAILIPITILFGKNLGGNEMYIPLFISSTLAKAMGIWAVYFFLSEEKRIKTVYLLLILAAFIQPLVSAQLFCLITGVFVLESLFFSTANSPRKIEIAIGVVVYVLTAGVWIYVLNRNFSGATMDTQLLFDCYEFRASHHYMPSYFPMKYYLLLVPTFLFGMLYFFKHEIRLFYFFGLAILGCVLYWIGVEQLQLSSILASQWFKSTVWLKAFSFVAIFAWIDHLMPVFRKSNFVNNLLYVGISLLGTFSIYTIVIKPPFRFLQNRTYELPFSSNINPEKDIALKAFASTPIDATFLIPFSNTHFKYWSKRSSYVEFKGFVHQQSAIPEWYDGIKAIYGVDVNTKRRGENLQDVADEFYMNLSVGDLEKFKARGVTYLLTFKEVDLPFEKVAVTEKYVIYQF